MLTKEVVGGKGQRCACGGQGVVTVSHEEGEERDRVWWKPHGEKEKKGIQLFKNSLVCINAAKSDYLRIEIWFDQKLVKTNPNRS